MSHTLVCYTKVCVHKHISLISAILAKNKSYKFELIRSNCLHNVLRHFYESYELLYRGITYFWKLCVQKVALLPTRLRVAGKM